MPLIFPGAPTGGNSGQSFSIAALNQAAFPVSYVLGALPEFHDIGSEDLVVSLINQGVDGLESEIEAPLDHRPEYLPTGGANGKPGLLFTGNEYLDISGEFLNVCKDVGGMTIAIVHKPELSNENMRLFHLSDDASLDGTKVDWTIYNDPRGLRVLETTPNDDYSFCSTFFTPKPETCCEFINIDFTTGTWRYYYNFILVFEGTFTDIGNTANIAALTARIGAGTGGDGGAFWGYKGVVTRFDVWKGSLDPVYLADLAQIYLTNYFPITNSSIDVVYCVGDSNMHGYGDLDYDQTIPWYIQENLNSPKPNTYVMNYGKDALPMRDMLAWTENEHYTIARMPAVNTRNRVMVIQCCTDDITLGIPVETIAANYARYVKFYASNGIKVIASTVLPRGDGDYDTEILALNAIITANYVSWNAVALMDSYNEVDLAYDFQDDDVHLNPSGTAKIGQLAVDTIEALQGWSSPTFEDLFDQGTLDTSKWITTLAWGGRNNGGTGEQQWYVDDAFSFDEDGLIITATDTETEPGYPYTSGVIETYGKFSQIYGYFESKMKLPAGKGAWPAFWLLPESIDWPPETDCMENGGVDPTKLYCSFHFKDANGDHDYVTFEIDVPDLSADFHTFGVEWRPDAITWYFNGAVVAQYTDATKIPAEPMYIIDNFAIGSNWEAIGFPDETTPWPMQSRTRYIRAWS